MTQPKVKQVFSPMGARILVQDIVSELSLEQRAQKVNLSIVVNDQNRPRSTQGIIVAIGDDPFLTETIIFRGKPRAKLQVGDIVTFSWHAGSLQIIEDVEFRSLEMSHIEGVFRDVSQAQSEEQQSDPLGESTPDVQTGQYLSSKPK